MEATAGDTPNQAAPDIEICPRCGSYAELSPFWGTPLCAACIERKAVTFREPVSLRSLLSGIAALPLRVWVLCAGVHLVFDIPSLLRTLAGTDPMRGLSLDILLSSIAGALVTYVAVKAALGERVTVLAACGAFGRHAGPWFRATLLAGLLILALTLLLVVPGIVRSLSLALTTPIVLFEPPSSATEVLDRSTKRMRGARWTALLAYALFGGLAVVVAVVASVVAEEGTTLASRIVAAAGDALGVVLGSPTALITAVLYLRLTPPDALPVRSAK